MICQYSCSLLTLSDPFSVTNMNGLAYIVLARTRFPVQTGMPLTFQLNSAQNVGPWHALLSSLDQWYIGLCQRHAGIYLLVGLPCYVKAWASVSKQIQTRVVFPANRCTLSLKMSLSLRLPACSVWSRLPLPVSISLCNVSFLQHGGFGGVQLGLWARRGREGLAPLNSLSQWEWQQ